jgi:hypothetical protein
VESGDCLKNIKFVDSRELREASDLVGSTASYHFQNARKPEQTESSQGPGLLDAQLEIVRLTDHWKTEGNQSARFYDLLRGISSTLDSQRVYHSLLQELAA